MPIVRKTIKLFIICLIASIQSVAQYQHSEFQSRYFPIDDGPWTIINSMSKDRTGDVWLSTPLGLYRFDGQEYKYYNHDPNDSTSLPSNDVFLTFDDSQDRLWVFGYEFGLGILDRQTGEFEKVKLPNFPKDIFISKILEPNPGQLLLVSAKGGIILIENYGTKHCIVKTYLNDIVFFDGKMDAKGNLWLVAQDKGLYVIKDLNFINNSIEVITTLKDHPLFNIDIYEDKILLTAHDKLFVYNSSTKEIKEVNVPYIQNSPGIQWQGIVKTKDSKYWLSVASAIFEFDAHLEIITRRITTPYNNMPEAGFSSILNLGEGKLLFGYKKGMYVIDFNKPIVHNIGLYEQHNEHIEWGTICSLLVDNEDIWYGNFTGGLSLRRKGKLYNFSLDNIIGNNKQAGYPVVLDMVKDMNNTIWFGGHFGFGYINLNTFEPDNPKITIFSPHKKPPYHFKYGDVIDLEVDGYGTIWGGSSSNGLFNLRQDSKGEVRVNYIKHTSTIAYKKAVNYINKLSIQDSTIWVGTVGGLLELVPTKDFNNVKIKNHYYKNNKVNPTISDTIKYLEIDVKNNLWVASNGGISKYADGELLRSWKSISTITNDMISSIISDLNGNLWISSRSGLIELDVSKNKFYRFDEVDGFRNLDFSRAQDNDDQGNLYFGGNYGITYFHPDDLCALKPFAKVYLSGIDETWKESEDYSFINIKDIENPLQINYNQLPVQLHFSSKGITTNPVKSLYYKLSPGNNRWTQMNGMDLQLVNLQPGNYLLEVSSRDYRGIWGSDSYRQKLEVIPPWWASTLAKSFYIALFILLTYFVYRFVLARKMTLAKTEKLQSINHSMTNFYSNITHEFKTPLTVIMGLAGRLHDQLSAKHKQDLSIISRNADNLSNMVNNIIDVSKNENGILNLNMVQSDIIRYLSYLCESYRTIAENNKIEFTFHSEQELFMDFDKDYIKGIIGNLVSNALKFTPSGGKVNIEVKKCKNNLLIKVSDDGIGILEEEQKLIFDKFYQSEHGNQNRWVGSGIGLSITRQYMEKLGGSIKLESRPGDGAIFKIVLPISNLADYIAYSDLTTINNTSVRNAQLGSKLIQEVTSDRSMVLIIEDNVDIHYYISCFLKKDYNVLVANNGEKGISMAIEQIPDIIITDVMMPRMDGFQVCEILQKDRRTDHIPIIMLTAKTDLDSRLKAISKGAIAYLNKPFNEEELKLLLASLLNTRANIIDKSKLNTSNGLEVKDKSPSTVFLSNINDIIAKRFNDSNFGPQQLAASVHMSNSQFYRKLKAIAGITPIQYINTIRLKQAKFLIETSEKLISEIAFEVGFNDPSYFGKKFKREYGQSPVAFQR